MRQSRRGLQRLTLRALGGGGIVCGETLPFLALAGEVTSTDGLWESRESDRMDLPGVEQR